MKVYELVKKLNEYNPNADIDVVVNGFSKEFKICFGGSEGCQPYNCDCVDLTVDTLCEEERDERMTDEEIKKALECCENGNPCSSCPYNGKCTDEDFNDNYLIKDVISLITRQKAEIERLNIEIKSMRSAANSYKIQYEKCAKEDVVDINVGKSDDIERVLQNSQQPKTNFEVMKNDTIRTH